MNTKPPIRKTISRFSTVPLKKPVPIVQPKISKEVNEKAYLDEMTNGRANIMVCIRVRPESASEKMAKNRGKPTIKVINENVLVFDPSDETTNISVRKRLQIGEKRGKDMKFAFDRVFDEMAPQKEVYENTTKFLLPGVLNGFNATVFANGATGSGKTYTMLGHEKGPGVLVLTIIELFQLLERCKNERSSKISISYLEVYNEQIRDLLKDTQSTLDLREDKDGGATVVGLSVYTPTTAQEVLDFLKAGNARRVQYETGANSESSRSHAIFQIQVETTDRTGNTKASVKMGKLSLIDLAGSERAAKTKNSGARLTEGANINKSLLALGNCINALARADGKKVYVPYRDSKLTRILKDSLGGNCRTVMIATLSPASICYEDTLNSLSYCDRAKQIKTNIERNVVSVDYHLSKYNKIIDELRSEVCELKKKLVSVDVPKAVKEQDKISPEQENARREILNEFGEKIKIKRQMMGNEDAARKNELEIFRKELEIRKWEIEHPDQRSPLLIVTLRGDIRNMSSISEGFLQSNVKLDASLQEMIKKTKSLQEKVPWECIEQDVRFHEQSCITLDWERQIQHYKIKDMRQTLAKEHAEFEIARLKKLLVEQNHSPHDINPILSPNRPEPQSPLREIEFARNVPKEVKKIMGYKERREKLFMDKQKSQEEPKKKVSFNVVDKMDIVLDKPVEKSERIVPNYMIPTTASAVNKIVLKKPQITLFSLNKENQRLALSKFK